MHAILMADVPPLPAHSLFTPNAQVSVDHPEIESGVEEDVPGVVVFTNEIGHLVGMDNNVLTAYTSGSHCQPRHRNFQIHDFRLSIEGNVRASRGDSQAMTVPGLLIREDLATDGHGVRGREHDVPPEVCSSWSIAWRGDDLRMAVGWSPRRSSRA
jgi:hypothetical protein